VFLKIGKQKDVSVFALVPVLTTASVLLHATFSMLASRPLAILLIRLPVVLLSRLSIVLKDKGIRARCTLSATMIMALQTLEETLCARTWLQMLPIATAPLLLTCVCTLTAFQRRLAVTRVSLQRRIRFRPSVRRSVIPVRFVIV
jgi:hypothetical protein